VFLRIAVGVPIADVLFVPEGVIANAPAEVVYHPFHVIDEGRDLSRRLGWPEDRIEAAIVIVKRARLRCDRVGQPAGGGRVHRVAVEELDLYLDPVVYPRTCSCAALSSFDLLGLSHAVNRKCPPSSPSVDQTKLERRWPACSWITSKACRAASERPSPDRPTLVGRQHLADLSQPSNKRNSYLRPAARCVNFCCEW